MRTSLILAAIAASALLGACGSDVQEVEESSGPAISADELAGRIRSGMPPLVLDVRSRDEYAKGHIPGAINVPHDELAARIAELPSAKSREIVVHCQSGRRAQLAEATLHGAGYSNVRDLSGHWQEWQVSELPTE
jgi:rhodanese-related sulfurtransferase